MALDSTLAGADSDSYVEDVAEALTFCDQLDVLLGLGVNTAGFRAAGTSGKESLLRMAADRMDQLPLEGVKQSDSQARGFPRQNLPRASYNGVIPDPAKLAQVADACDLGTAAGSAAAAAASGISSYSIAEKSVTFAGSAVSSSNPAAGASGAARAILTNAGLLGSSSVGSVYVPRG